MKMANNYLLYPIEQNCKTVMKLQNKVLLHNKLLLCLMHTVTKILLEL